jgi:hypothetical protein
MGDSHLSLMHAHDNKRHRSLNVKPNSISILNYLIISVHYTRAWNKATLTNADENVGHKLKGNLELSPLTNCLTTYRIFPMYVHTVSFLF